MGINANSYMVKYEYICRPVDSVLRENIKYLVNDDGTGFSIFNTRKMEQHDIKPERIPKIKEALKTNKGNGLIVGHWDGYTIYEPEIVELLIEGIEIMEHLGSGKCCDRKEKKRKVG